MLRVHPGVVVAYRLFWGLLLAVCFGRQIPLLTAPLVTLIVWSFVDIYQDVPNITYFVLVQLLRMATNVTVFIVHLTTYYGSLDNALVQRGSSELEQLTVTSLVALIAFDIYSALAFHYFSTMERKYSTVPTWQK